MKNQSFILALLIAVLLTWLGYYNYPMMVMWLMPQVAHVQYMIASAGDYVTDALWFGLACGIIPLLLYFLWNITQTTDTRGQTLSGFILVFVCSSAIFIHYIIVKDLIGNAALSTQVIHFFDLGTLMYHFYLLVGELIGGTVAFYVLKKRKRLL